MTIILHRNTLDPTMWDVATVHLSGQEYGVWACIPDDLLHANGKDIDPGEALTARTGNHIECVIITRARYNWLVAKEAT